MPSAPPPRARYKLAPEVDLLTIEYVTGDGGDGGNGDGDGRERGAVDPVAREMLASMRLPSIYTIKYPTPLPLTSTLQTVANRSTTTKTQQRHNHQPANNER